MATVSSSQLQHHIQHHNRKARPMIIHNVRDRRRHEIGSWTAEPLDVDELTEADVGRTVIYRDHGRAEAGVLTSWRGTTVFAMYSSGDTAAGANASDLVFGLHPIALGHFAKL